MKRNFVICLVIIIVCGSALVLFIPDANEVTALDVSEANDISSTVSSHWDEIVTSGDLPPLDYDLNYSVIDNDGNLIAKKPPASSSINEAIHNRDTILDISVDGRLCGKVLIHNDMDASVKDYRRSLIHRFYLALLILGILFGLLLLYVFRSVLAPFGKMKGFARRVAAGDLDIPLEMDKHNLFGSFTESFDILREELKKARENERQAVKDKRELVASLSHDIKTPVASIKAVAELASVKTDDEEKARWNTIITKSEQINTLITDMFHATLEELQELPVNATDVPSSDIYNMIKEADYLGQVADFTLPDCIALADPVRLSQVVDNVISNSYKYAETPIAVKSYFLEEKYLCIEIADSGPGVAPEDLPLICGKFYRGSNADGKSGYGLGLYISNYLMERQDGDLVCSNAESEEGGFIATLRLSLA